MKTLTNASHMNSSDSQPRRTDAFALRGFVLNLVESLQMAARHALLWKTREEGIEMIEEILLEGRACGFETREGFEELCRTSIALQIGLPFSRQIRQGLKRAGLSELQRVENLRLSLINQHHHSAFPQLPQASRN